MTAHGVLILPKEPNRFQRKIDINGEKRNVYTVRGSVTDLLSDEKFPPVMVGGGAGKLRTPA